MSTSLDNVEQLLQNPNFYQNQDQFWQIMSDICQNQTVLSKSECQHLAIQLNLAIENAPNFQIIQYYVEII